MDTFHIIGGAALNGSVSISGAKNAALPIIAASILADGLIELSSVPRLKDVATMLDLLDTLGISSEWIDRNELVIHPSSIVNNRAPYDLVKTMRASILVLGPLLGKYGEAQVSLPGGCAIGSRPVDLHIDAMRALGAHVTLENGFISAQAPNGLHGAIINFPKITVTGTANVITAAVLANGRTVINNAAKEPEIVDLCSFLVKGGAQITGAGTKCIIIDGVASLKPITHSIVSDRIEAATFLVAAVVTRGELTLTNVVPDHLRAVLQILEDAGAYIEERQNSLFLTMRGSRPSAISFVTEEYPGVPTDVQAQLMALNCLATCDGLITENIFENRFMHVQELIRMGADLTVSGKSVHTKGVDMLTGTQVMATDLRASAGLVLAALMAKGETIIHRIYHIDRGYENIESKLAQLGANIVRQSSSIDKKVDNTLAMV